MELPESQDKSDKSNTDNLFNRNNSQTTINRGAAPFPVAGIGASAGGLEALSDF
jgi:chemotaxis response regulator CheB